MVTTSGAIADSIAEQYADTIAELQASSVRRRISSSLAASEKDVSILTKPGSTVRASKRVAEEESAGWTAGRVVAFGGAQRI